MGYQRYKFSHDLKRSRGLWASIHTSCRPKTLKISQCFSALEADVLSHRHIAISHSENWETAPKITLRAKITPQEQQKPPPAHSPPPRQSQTRSRSLSTPAFPYWGIGKPCLHDENSQIKVRNQLKNPFFQCNSTWEHFPSCSCHKNSCNPEPHHQQAATFGYLNVYIWHKNSRLNRRVWNSSLLALNTICFSFRLLCKVRN